MTPFLKLIVEVSNNNYMKKCHVLIILVFTAGVSNYNQMKECHILTILVVRLTT